jgi:hypothetical protein
MLGFKTFEDLQKFYRGSNDGFACFIEDKGVWVWVRYYGEPIPEGATVARDATGHSLVLQ